MVFAAFFQSVFKYPELIASLIASQKSSPPFISNKFVKVALKVNRLNQKEAKYSMTAIGTGGLTCDTFREFFLYS
jgi:hypothetical protein